MEKGKACLEVMKVEVSEVAVEGMQVDKGKVTLVVLEVEAMVVERGEASLEVLEVTGKACLEVTEVDLEVL